MRETVEVLDNVEVEGVGVEEVEGAGEDVVGQSRHRRRNMRCLFTNLQSLLSCRSDQSTAIMAPTVYAKLIYRVTFSPSMRRVILKKI